MTEEELKAIEAGAEWATPRLVYLGGDDFKTLVAEVRRLRAELLETLADEQVMNANRGPFERPWPTPRAARLMELLGLPPGTSVLRSLDCPKGGRCDIDILGPGTCSKCGR